MELLWSYFLEIEQPIEAPYLIINEAEGGWDNIADLPADHPEKQELATINEFLKPHHWACKGPVQLKYKSNRSKVVACIRPSRAFQTAV